MAVNEGPKTKGEALRWVAEELADLLEGNSLGVLFPGVRMSVPQRERVSNAVDEVTRRLRAMGAPKGPGEEES
ncbi:MAG TPA: hypothetical protein VGG75_13815 [Trebonia sp.]|jgi:hypothetical protein